MIDRFTLLALAALLAPSTSPASRSAVVDDAIDAVDVPLFGGEDGREKTAALMISIAWYESAWRANVVGDAGRSCGVMQAQTPQKWIKGATCDRVRADRVLGFRVGLRVLAYTRSMCGGPAVRWLGMYASGVCGFAQVAARRRCAPAGVCEEQ